MIRAGAKVPPPYQWWSTSTRDKATLAAWITSGANLCIFDHAHFGPDGKSVALSPRTLTRRDGKHGVAPEWQRLAAEHRRRRGPRSGHRAAASIWYSSPIIKLGNHAALPEGIDVRGHHGYVLAAARRSGFGHSPEEQAKIKPGEYTILDDTPPLPVPACNSRSLQRQTTRDPNKPRKPMKPGDEAAIAKARKVFAGSLSRWSNTSVANKRGDQAVQQGNRQRRERRTGG